MNKILLFGNPNVGKTTVFNDLTNSNEKVSNFEGATILRKSAFSRCGDFEVVDLPGIYGISGKSEINKIVLESLITENPDYIIDVIDINNLKKSNYLLIDLLETGLKTAIYLNMSDLFSGDIDLEKFSHEFSARAHLTTHNENFCEVLITDIENKFKIDYGFNVEEAVSKLEKLVDENKIGKIEKRFFAIQFLKENDLLEQYFTNFKEALKIKEELLPVIISNENSHSISGFFFKKRRERIIKILDKSNYESIGDNNEMSFMNKYFDKIALNKYFGFFLFGFIMYMVFYLSTASLFLSDWIDYIFSILSNISYHLLSFAPDVVSVVLVDGVLAGVGAIMVFLPQIIIMFTLITILEGIGYFPRVSVLFERLFNKMGLSAQSLIPLLSGVGCNVVGISTSKVITNPHKRIATILAAPFISCSARLPVYLIFTGFFFKDSYINIGPVSISLEPVVITFLYFLGIVVAVLYAFVVSKFFYKSSEETSVISLPKYQMVKSKYLSRMVYIKIKSFVVTAGKLILIGSFIISLLSVLGPTGVVDDIDDSFITIIAQPISVIFVPLGFGTVEATASLMMSFLAKELTIPVMISLYSVSESNLMTEIGSHFTTASALSFMVFSLLYIPCLSTLGAIYNETKQVKFVIISVVTSFIIGYVLALATYNISLLFGL